MKQSTDVAALQRLLTPVEGSADGSRLLPEALVVRPGGIRYVRPARHKPAQDLTIYGRILPTEKAETSKDKSEQTL